MKKAVNAVAIVAVLFATIGTAARAAETIVRIGITPFQDTVLPVGTEKRGWFAKAGRLGALYN